MSDSETARLVERWRAGDQSAATELHDRYVIRLIALVRKKLESKYSHRISPDDVVQSAWRTFFRRASNGQYDLRRSGDLWRLMSKIAVNKLKIRQRYHDAARRSPDREWTPTDPVDVESLSAISSTEPDPADAAALLDLVERFMQELAPDDRTILEHRLQDCSVPEIAEKYGRTERTIRRRLERIRETLGKWKPAGHESDGE